MKNADYGYQKIAVNQVLENLKSHSIVLLGCATGGGKSYMAKDIIVELAKNPNNKIVFLAHGQGVLRKQFIEILDNTINGEFEYGLLGGNKQVSVGLPHFFNNNSVGKITHLIVDEAHEYFMAEMEQAICKKYNPKVILLTGSPGKYNKRRDIKCVYIPGEEMLRRNVYSAVDLDMVRIDKPCVKFSLDASFKKLQAKGAKLDKIMIVCKNIMQAKITKGYMERHGYKTALSTSDNDDSGHQIDLFKKNKEYKCLVVVNRGILGFNEGRITALIDLKGSNNLDTVNQYFSRLLRIHPEGLDKFFIRVSNGRRWNKDVQLLHDIIELMTLKTFKNYIT
jgi:superfamily II DNA or RNA helicase